MGNVEVAWEDVISVINMVRTHLIIIAIAFIAMIAVMIIVRKKEKLIKRMIRFQSFFAFLLITVVTLNVAAAETLYNTLNVVLSDKGTLDQGHIDNSKKVIEDVTNEGVVMTKNDNSFLRSYHRRSMYSAGHQLIRYMEEQDPEQSMLLQR